MNNKVLRYKGFSVTVAQGWDDITETLDDDDPPLTIADPTHGVGASQISAAMHNSGWLPQVASRDLSELLYEFASKHDWGDPFNRSTYSGEVAIEGASFQAGDDSIRVWYASDGKNVILVTYVCDWTHRDQEASERELAIRSVCFNA